MIDPREQLAEEIYDHTMGTGNPVVTIVQKGIFPPNWHSRFMSLVEKAEQLWGTSRYLPRKLVASIHYVNLHVSAYYETWCHLNGSRNEKTDTAMHAIRWRTEAFLTKKALEEIERASN